MAIQGKREKLTMIQGGGRTYTTRNQINVIKNFAEEIESKFKEVR